MAWPWGLGLSAGPWREGAQTAMGHHCPYSSIVIITIAINIIIINIKFCSMINNIIDITILPIRKESLLHS